MDRVLNWGRRLHGAEIGFPLGKQSDIWRLIPKHPANDWVRHELIRFGRDSSDEAVALYTTRSLLLDVIHAATGIEYTVVKIKGAVSEARQWTTQQHIFSNDVHTEIGHDALTVAFFEYANLLTWIKTLQDRIRSDEPRTGKRGLIPSLKPDLPLTRNIQTSYDLLDKAFAGEENLRNFALHMHAIPRSGAAVAEPTDRGDITLKIPDRVLDPVYLFDQFTFQQDRDLETFADHAIDVVGRFIDELLAAFEIETLAFMERQATNAERRLVQLSG